MKLCQCDGTLLGCVHGKTCSRAAVELAPFFCGGCDARRSQAILRRLRQLTPTFPWGE